MKKAFTLVELIIVIVILGVIAGLAFPKLTGQMEQSYVSEAVTALQALHGAQLRYELEHAGTYVVNCASLDVTVAPKNFGAPVCEADGDVILTRNGGAYTITQDKDGVFSCSGCPGSVKLPQ